MNPAGIGVAGIQSLAGEGAVWAAGGRRWLRLAFAVGDSLFLTLIGLQAALVMYAVNRAGWAFPIGSIAGMAAAMGVQMFLAFAVAPLLGSIESMTPSMVVAMVSPMVVDGLAMMGPPPAPMECAGLGAGFGLLMAVLVQVYGVACRRRLRRITA
jgi:hypothetical protein